MGFYWGDAFIRVKINKGRGAYFRRFFSFGGIIFFMCCVVLWLLYSISSTHFVIFVCKCAFCSIYRNFDRNLDHKATLQFSR